jgi:hypothetical protein
MSTEYGLTVSGFIAKQQQVIKGEIEDSLRVAFGTNLNLLGESVLGQLVGIFSEREALLWQLAEAVYASQYPGGAEGTSVDNILALNGLKRLGATPSKTSPTEAGINGLELYGDAGTIVPIGSLARVPGSTKNFQITADATILAAVNAVQSIYFTSVPNSGSMVLRIVAPSGVTLDTTPLNFDATSGDVQSAIRALHDLTNNNYPYTDVVVSGAYTSGFSITFGAGTPTGANPSSGSQKQNLFTLASNTLQTGATAVNVQIVATTLGSVAKAVSAAICAENGPIPAPAGTLTEIVTPVSGWTGVNNPLDVIVGTNIETDTEALQRRLTLLATEANGPLQSIVEKVRLVSGVSAAIGFENLNIAAEQTLFFADVPDAGNFRLQLAPGTTALIPFSATAATIQAAINLLTEFEEVLVIGDWIAGFTIDFNGATGGQAQPLTVITTNTLTKTGNPVGSAVEFTRPGKAFEIVVAGGSDNDIAQAIYESKPAGIETYGNQSVIITDRFGQPYTIKFSRPTQMPVYVAITLNVKQSLFPPDGVGTIQSDILGIGNAIPIGGTIVGFGSNGLVGAFNDVPGIVSYSLAFGIAPNPVTNSNIQLQAAQQAAFESFRIIVTVNYV